MIQCRRSVGRILKSITDEPISGRCAVTAGNRERAPPGENSGNREFGSGQEAGTSHMLHQNQKKKKKTLTLEEGMSGDGAEGQGPGASLDVLRRSSGVPPPADLQHSSLSAMNVIFKDRGSR